MRFDFQPWEKVQKGWPPLQVRISEMLSWEESAILFENLIYILHITLKSLIIKQTGINEQTGIFLKIQYKFWNKQAGKTNLFIEFDKQAEKTFASMVEKKSPKPKRACFFIGDFRVMFEKIEATHIFGGYMQRERP